MSGNNQNNLGKMKTASNSSSMVNTPASTPVTSMANGGQNNAQTSPPPNNNAPKYGTLVPNRIFVGGIAANTTEGELLQLFSSYGTVKAAKIIQDRAGVSKGYGFITFESEDDAKRLQHEADNIVLRERKLNIAPAIKKQPFSRAFDASSPPTVAPGNPAQYFFPPGGMPFFQGGVAYYAQPPTGPADPATQQPVYQPPSVYPPQSAPPQTAAYQPMMFPAPPIYMPQQYPMPVPYDYNYYPNGGAQYMVGGQGGPQSQIPPMQRANSPPRPPCYGQQLPSYNAPPDTAVYYNMPTIYSPVDPTLYTTDPSLDVSMSNGALSEEFSAVGDGPRQDEGVSRQQQHHHKNADVDDSNTPVVSVLALDQHQEKDLMSMQSGRRRKIVPNQPQNGYLNYQYPPMTYNVPPYPYNNIQDKNKKFRNKNENIPRSDSNSSASVVDENRNEDKQTLNNNQFSQIAQYNKIKNFQNRRAPITPKYRLPTNKPPISPLSQMHSSSQHFLPPTRRNKRTVRRNGSSTLSEIGAGDAPLPNTDVSEACTKLDGLKL